MIAFVMFRAYLDSLTAASFSICVVRYSYFVLRCKWLYTVKEGHGTIAVQSNLQGGSNVLCCSCLPYFCVVLYNN